MTETTLSKKKRAFDSKLQSPTLFSPHVAAYPPGRVHRAVPPHQSPHAALRRPMAARDQARWLPRGSMLAKAGSDTGGGGGLGQREMALTGKNNKPLRQPDLFFGGRNCHNDVGA